MGRAIMSMKTKKKQRHKPGKNVVSKRGLGAGRNANNFYNISNNSCAFQRADNDHPP